MSLSAYLYIFVAVYLSIDLSIYVSIYLSISPSLSLSLSVLSRLYGMSSVLAKELDVLVAQIFEYLM